MNQNLRQVIHDHMAQIAAQHTAAACRQTMDGDTPAQLFALLKDDDPAMAPINGWLAWRAAHEQEDARP
jgi:hypothetical protein